MENEPELFTTNKWVCLLWANIASYLKYLLALHRLGYLGISQELKKDRPHLEAALLRAFMG